MEGCGWGGRATADGNDAQGVINGNCRNTPVEVFETRYPWRVHGIRLVAGSGGAGRFRGGLASERMLEVTADAITVSEFADRAETRPWGLHGGEAGTSAATYVRLAGNDRWQTFREAFGTASATKFSGIVLHRGDQVTIRTAGGGGYGPPGERAADATANDREEGFVDG